MNKLASVLLALLAGCAHGGSNGGSASPPAGSATAVSQGDPTGFWSGALTTAPIPSSMVWQLQLRDSAGQLIGTWSNDQGASGTISGAVLGEHLTFVMDQTVPCVATYHGTADMNTLDQNQVMGIQFSGSDCQGSLSVTGTLAW